MADQRDQKDKQQPTERGGQKSADQQGKPNDRQPTGKGSEGTGSAAGGRGSNA